jgi:hypothetical protein
MAKAKGKTVKAKAGRSGGVVDAPGKAHRKPAPSARGAKHSDQMIPNAAVEKVMRRPQRRG